MKIPSILLLTACLLTIGRSEPTSPASPISRLTKPVYGWNVKIDLRLLEGGDLYETIGKRAVTRVISDLGRISILVPGKQLRELRKVMIILDEHPSLKGAQYHPSRKWLIENGHEAALAKCVHITKASLYADPEHILVQPSVLIHELSHSYHDQVLGYDYEPLKKAFARAQLEGRYAKVLFITGGMRKHYALSNEKEYFAEATEAWFGTNDFYPFVRSELQAHDPGLYELMAEIWGR
ncbi:MAG: hypothetical protein P1U87_05850 [Verrucomicrobiales bacterium]|nr:hypothetical protein [Verrucomicrobiales bacterium]